jgi:hypothetical protein
LIDIDYLLQLFETNEILEAIGEQKCLEYFMEKQEKQEMQEL